MNVMRRLVLASVISLVVLGGDALAQQKTGGLQKQIQGHWTLASQYVEQDGKKTEAFGSNPKGSMILTPDGRFSILLMKSDIPKFAVNNRVKGTAEENQAVVHGSTAYFGSYTVASEKDKTVSLRIEGSTFPNWNGEEQKRVMTVAGNELRVTNPTAGIGGTAYIVWKRNK